jgi:glycolate oxidase FAD binding subunit
MSAPRDSSDSLRDRVRAARSQGGRLWIRAGGSKDFLGAAPPDGAGLLDVVEHCGVVSYEPSELVVTVRCGTALAELQEVLAAEGQMLPFEPPAFGAGATIGGAVSSGLSGPRRPYTGSVRDAVLGVRLLTGRGECLSFGGQVMKNVAGYDVSRLVAGAWGTLGVLLEISLKVMPLPEHTLTLQQEADTAQALTLFSAWARQPLPISAACHLADTVHVRLSGGPAALKDASRLIGGREQPDADAFWSGIREQTHPFYSSGAPLWRLGVPPAAPPLDLPGEWLLDWGGAQRWLVSDTPADQIRAQVERAGGHALLFRHAPPDVPRCHPLPPALAALQSRVRAALDPDGLFNPGHPMGVC